MFPKLSNSLPQDCLHCGQLVDETAQHFCGGCKYGGHRQYVHNQIANILKSIINSTGSKATTAIPVRHATETTIPDIEVYRQGKRDLIDVTIVNRLLPHHNTEKITPSTFHTSTAESREKSKISSYQKRGVISTTDLTVVPFAVETLGRIGPLGYEYLKSLAKRYRKGFKATTIRRYWFQKISVALQNAIGHTVQRRLDEHITRNLDNDEERMLEEEVLETIEHHQQRCAAVMRR